MISGQIDREKYRELKRDFKRNREKKIFTL